MKLSIGILLCFLVLEVNSQSWFQFMKEAAQGTGDMWRAYRDLQDANWRNADKYFHARGNYEAAQRGPGGAWAAEFLSNARKNYKIWTGRDTHDLEADQFADEWGRSGRSPDIFRPRELPRRY